MKPIDLDHATLTRPLPQAIQAMLPFYDRDWGSPSLPTKRGQQLLPAIEESLRALLSLVDGRDEDTFLLTSSGAEAVNQIIHSVYHKVTLDTGKNGYLASVTDEAPTILSMDRLQDVHCVPKMIPVDAQGRVTAAAVADQITPRTALVSLSWANPLTGVIHPVEEIADICRERGILLHLEASSVLGKLHFQREDLRADYLTFRGEALHGPLGTGGLWIREGAPIDPLFVGGPDQGGLRPGALNVPGLVGLATAAQEILRQREYFGTEISRLRNKLEKGIVALFPDAIPLFTKQERLPHISAIAFPGIANEALQYVLNEKNVFCSIGGGAVQQMSVTLQAAGIEKRLAHTALSFSLSLFTSEQEIDDAIQRIADAVHFLRTMTPQEVLTP